MLILYTEHYIGSTKNVSRVSAANHVKARDLDVKTMYFEVDQSHFYPNHFECYKIVSVSNFRDPSLDIVPREIWVTETILELVNIHGITV